MGNWVHTQAPRRKGYSHSWEGHRDIFLEAQEILFPLWVPLQGVLGSNRLLLRAKEEKTKQPREVSATFTTERSLKSTVWTSGRPGGEVQRDISGPRCGSLNHTGCDNTFPNPLPPFPLSILWRPDRWAFYFPVALTPGGDRVPQCQPM